MSKRDQRLFLDDIIVAIDKIEDYTASMNIDEFLADKKTIDAVMLNIEIIGEAVKNLANEIKQQNDDINWQGVAGMRDRLIHGYFGVDFKIVWETAKRKLPELRSRVNRILSEMDG